MAGNLSKIIGSRAACHLLACLSLIVGTAGLAQGAQTIGGQVYANPSDPMMSGEGGVGITVTGTGGTFTTTTASVTDLTHVKGVWSVDNVPDGTYTVTAVKLNRKLWHMLSVKPDLQAFATITVSAANMQVNQDIQFLASNVGGIICTDLAHPTTTGLSGVTLTLTPDGGDPVTTTSIRTTTGVDGWWQVSVPANLTYRVTPSLEGRTFEPAYIDVTATSGNLEANTTLQFKALGSATATKLAFTTPPAGSYAPGATISTQVTVQDAGGNTMSDSTAAVTLTLVPVAPTVNTTFTGTATRTASGGVAGFNDLAIATVGTYKFHAAATGLTAADSSQFTITTQQVSASNSSVTADPLSVTANGSDITTLTITVKDTNNNVLPNIPGSNIVVTASGSNNTIGTPSTTDAAGQSVVTIASTKAETKTITVTVQGVTLNQPQVTFVPGPVHAGQSTVTASPSAALADGSAAITLTITAKDANANPIAGIAGAQIAVTAGGSNNTISSPAATNDSGQTTVTFRSTTAESKTITAVIQGVTLSQHPQVTFTSVPVSVAKSSVTIDTTPVVADGSAFATVTITVRDAGNNPLVGIPGTDIVVDVTGSNNTISPPTATNASGQSTVTIRSITAESKTITVVVQNVTLSQHPQVTFVAGPVSGSHSTITPNPNPVAVLQSQAGTSTITIVARDVHDNPIAGILAGDIVVSATGNYTVTQPVNATDGEGTTTALVSGMLAGTTDVSVTIKGTPVTGSGNVITVTFSGEACLTIAAEGLPDPVNPDGTLTYTITFSNINAGQALNTKIVETLPDGLIYVSHTGNATYNTTTRKITWDIGTVAGGSVENPVTSSVSFVVTLDATWLDGGPIKNDGNHLTITCDPPGVVMGSYVPDVMVVDKKPPTVTAVNPTKNQEMVDATNIVALKIEDKSGVDCATVKIQIQGSIVYDGAQASDPNRYDSTGADQPVRGICTRSGLPTSYTFTFAPTVPMGYEKVVHVRVDAADLAEPSNTMTNAEEYDFTTAPRSFGKNGRVNSFANLLQDNPATAVDPTTGAIWVVWEQEKTLGSADRDIYVGQLPSVDANSFEVSLPVTASTADERNPALAISADGTPGVAWQQKTANGHWAIYFSAFLDGAWTTPTNVTPIQPPDALDRLAPALAAAGNSLYVVWQQNNGSESTVWLGTSTNHGTSWTLAQISQNTTSAIEPTLAVGPAPNYLTYIAWTDSRNAATGKDIYLAGSNDTPQWKNVAVVSGAGDQSGPTVAVGNFVHLAWLDVATGKNDIMYARGPDFITGSILDQTPTNTAQKAPRIVVRNAFGADTVFACWEDGRDVANNNGDTDIYFAESSSPFGTNVLVNDDEGTSAQTKPRIGVNQDGEPYLIWVDKREGNQDIYYAGATALVNNPYMGKKPPITDGTGKVTIPSEKPNLNVILPSIDVLPPGITADQITVQQVVNPPTFSSDANAVGLCYDFGPSGIQFPNGQPVTLQIPLPAGHASYSVYNVWRWNSTNLLWESDGIYNPATLKSNGSGDYLEVRVTHFSIYGTTGSTAAVDSSAGGGGCALTPWSRGSPGDYVLPFAAYVLVLLGITGIDRLRRRAGAGRR